MSEVSVRNMTKDDISIVSKFIYESFWQKMLPLHSLNEEEALKLIQGIMFSDPRSMEFYFLAIVDDGIKGMVKLRTKEDKEEFHISDHRMLLKIGVIKLIKAGILLSVLETKVLKEHLYIEMIAVDDESRGQGIGSVLLEYSEAKARKLEGIKKLSLHVIEKNAKAKKLYEKIGFKTISSQWNSVVKGLGGIRKLYFMTKDL